MEGPPRVEPLLSSGVDLRFKSEVTAVTPGPSVVTPLEKTAYDSVVIATGSVAVQVRFPGFEKSGVHMLNSAEAYFRLFEACADYSRVAVLGEGFASLEAAENLMRLSIDTTLFSHGRPLLAHFHSSLRKVLFESAGSLGLRVQDALMHKAVGVGRVEAVMVGDEVLPCDAVAVVPQRIPLFPPVPILPGRLGGIVVDAEMRCGIPGVFVAGDCAEYPVGRGSRLMMLRPTAEAGGKIAGVNATGGSAKLVPVGCFSRHLFGLEVSAAGLGLDEALSLGFDAAESAFASSSSTVASVVFHRRSGRVLGIQHVGNRRLSTEFLTMSVARGVHLGELALMETAGSTDISAILEAAREGMEVG